MCPDPRFPTSLGTPRPPFPASRGSLSTPRLPLVWMPNVSFLGMKGGSSHPLYGSPRPVGAASAAVAFGKSEDVAFSTFDMTISYSTVSHEHMLAYCIPTLLALLTCRIPRAAQREMILRMVTCWGVRLKHTGKGKKSRCMERKSLSMPVAFLVSIYWYCYKRESRRRLLAWKIQID